MIPVRDPIAVPREVPLALLRLVAELEQLVDQVPLEDGPALIGDLERLKTKIWIRMMEATQAPAVAPPETQNGDRLLSIPEAAEMLGVSVSGMKSRVQRGRERIRRMFEECCEISVDCRGHVTDCTPRNLDEVPADCRDAAASWAARRGA